MIQGKTEVETLKLNGWGVGDILEGDEGRGPDRILITRIGEERFGCKWDRAGLGEWGNEQFNTTLSCREWRKVGRIDEPPAWDGEGLPPVGCECESLHVGSMKWTACTVMGYSPDGREVWIKRHSSQRTNHVCATAMRDFRPIRSAEDRAVDAMANAGKCSMATETAAAMIASGIYRAIRDGKVPGVKLEDRP